MKLPTRLPLHKPMLAAGPLLLGAIICAGSPAIAQQPIGSEKDPRRANSATVVAEPDKTPKDDANKKDGDRMDPSFQPKGVELGQFLLLPKVEVDETHNNNIFATSRGEQHDFITIVRPEMALNSQFERHMINLLVAAEDHRYARFETENHFDTKVLATGRLDVTDATEINGYAQHLNRAEDRGSPDEAGGRSPAETYTTEAQLGAKHRFGAFVVSGESTVRRLEYGNVESAGNSVISNADRERDEISASARGMYEFFPSYSAVVEAGGNKRDYRRKTDRNGLERSSTGQHFLTGLGVDVSALVRGDFLVGYMRQDYDDNRLRDVSGPMVRATFNWTPTPQTLIVPAVEHSVAETVTQNVSGIKRLSASVLTRYEMRRNILLSAYASLAREEFEGTNQSDIVGEGWARASYAFNSNVYVATQVGHREKSVENTTGDFEQTTFMLRLGLQM